MPSQFWSSTEGMAPPLQYPQRCNLETWRTLHPRRILHASGAINVHGSVTPGEPRTWALRYGAECSADLAIAGLCYWRKKFKTSRYFSNSAHVLSVRRPNTYFTHMVPGCVTSIKNFSLVFVLVWISELYPYTYNGVERWGEKSILRHGQTISKVALVALS